VTKPRNWHAVNAWQRTSAGPMVNKHKETGREFRQQKRKVLDQASSELVSPEEILDEKAQQEISQLMNQWTEKDNKNPEDPGKKFDFGKPPMSLVPTEAIREVAKVLDYGAKKYDPWNWKKGMKWSRLQDAALRHQYAWAEGENKDLETGLSHLAHSICCLMFLLTYEILGLGQDDRWKKP
jgi:hypothetical protein